jgi:FkbM family methyltransferase
MRALLGRLRHPDPSQLLYQVAEIAGDETYLRGGVTVEPGDVVLDVGANVGVAAVWFAAERGAGTVHCFEPVPAIAAVLRENVAGLAACTVHETALGAAPGTVEMTYYPRSAAMSGAYADPARDRAIVATALRNAGLGPGEIAEQLAGRYDDREVVRCPVTTVSAFLRERALSRVDLLKVDVERGELDVLAGIEEADWPRIAQVAIEVHDVEGRVSALAADLSARGFTVTHEQDEPLRGTEVHLLAGMRR